MLEENLSYLKTIRNWENELMQFSITRSFDQALFLYIPKPLKKICPLCLNEFVENSLPMPLMDRLGAENLDYCAPCLRDSVTQDSGKENSTPLEIRAFVQDLTKALEVIPPQGFGEGINDLKEFSADKRTAILKILSNRPSYKIIRATFGSWLHALIDAGVLMDGTRETPRGTHTLAIDGHVCLSLGEKTIDDYLFRKNIPHKREIHYPTTRYRTDFVVENVFIEYFGLAGNQEYDLKITEKRNLCKAHNIQLIEIYPKDLINVEKLSKKLEILNQYSSKK